MELVKGMRRNISDKERWASTLGGGSLAAFGLSRRGPGGYALAAVGGALLWRGLTGHCDIYQALGRNTANKYGRNVSIPYELGIRVDQSVHIDKPSDEVYAFWRELEHLPRFMQHVERVDVLDDRRSHWVASGPAGMHVEWEAEIINEVPGRIIGWRSLEGADVDNAGSVHFDPSPDGRGCDVKVELQYNPPAGSLGAAVARLLGEDPAQQIRDDLRRFKELMEKGAITSKSLQLRQREPVTAGRVWDRDKVTSSSEESFPASDPPSWTPEAL